MLVLEGHASPVYALTFAPDGHALVSGSKDGVVLLWDGGGEPRRIASYWEKSVHAVGVHPLDDLTIVGGEHGWNRVMLDPVRTASFGPTEPVTGLAFVTPTLLAVGHGNRARPEPGRLVLWNVRPHCKRREPVVNAPHGVRSVATHPPSNRVAWSEWDRRLFVWDPSKTDPVRFNLPHNAASVAFHPDGQLLAASQEWGVRVFDLDRKQERYHSTGHKGQVTSVAFSPDGRTLATGSWDGTVRYWDAATGRETACYTWPTGKVFALAYAPDGLRLAAAGASGSIVVWDVD